MLMKTEWANVSDSFANTALRKTIDIMADKIESWRGNTGRCNPRSDPPVRAWCRDCDWCT
jgi:hypothetical protein